MPGARSGSAAILPRLAARISEKAATARILRYKGVKIYQRAWARGSRFGLVKS
jgi:hypothetical protein